MAKKYKKREGRIVRETEIDADGRIKDIGFQITQLEEEIVELEDEKAELESLK